MPHDPFDKDRSGRCVFFDHEDHKILGYADVVSGIVQAAEATSNGDRVGGFTVEGADTILLAPWLREREAARGQKWTFMVRDRKKRWVRVVGAWVQRFSALPPSWDFQVDAAYHEEEPDSYMLET